MIKFLEYSDYSLLKVFIAQELGFDVLDTLLKTNSVLNKKIPDNIVDLNSILSQGSGLFDSTEEKYLIDLQNISFDSKTFEILIKALSSFKDLDIYLFSSGDGSLNADLKKVWQKAGFTYTLLKNIDPEVAKSIADKYLALINVSLGSKELNIILKESSTYSKLIDDIDFVSLGYDQSIAAQSLIAEEKVPIFVLGFDPNKLSSQIKRWYTEIGEDEVQLALSLIFGKLDKNGNEISLKLAKELILTDQRIKTRSKVNSLVWYRLFLWQSLSQV